MSRPILALLCVLAASGCAAHPALPEAAAGVRIGAVQGPGAASPLLGNDVDATGVVTLLLDDGRSGWFLQDAGDGDPATSDGVLVTGAAAVPAVGDRVRVRGRVLELDAGNGATVTALAASEMLRLGGGATAPAAARIDAAPADWERVRRHARAHRLRHSPSAAAAPWRATANCWPASAGACTRRPKSPTPARPHSASARTTRAARLLLDDARTEPDPAGVWYLPAGAPRTGSVARRGHRRARPAPRRLAAATGRAAAATRRRRGRRRRSCAGICASPASTW